MVFDGATRPPAMPPAPRGVRVLFSAPGEIADDVIRRLVAAEPEGRPLMVVSSDKEVADRRRPGRRVRGAVRAAAPPPRPRLTGRHRATGRHGRELSYPLLSVTGVTDPEGEL